MSFDIFFETKKNGKFSNRASSYRVLYSGGVALAATAMTIVTGETGKYYATVNPNNWSPNTDGQYLIHMYVTNKANQIDHSKFLWVTIVDQKLVSVASDDAISTIVGKLPNNFIMGSSVQTDLDGRFDSVILAAQTHAGVTIPNVTNVSTVGTVTTLTGHTPQSGDSFPIVNSGVYGNQAIKNQTNKIDAAATSSPGAAFTGSLLDRLCNKDGGKTYDQALASLEAIRERGDIAWITGGGAGGGSFFDMLILANAVTATRKITILPREGGLIVPTTELNLVIARRVPSSTPETSQTLVAASPNTDGFYDLELNFTPAVGEVYTVSGTIKFGTTNRAVGSGFNAQ